MAEKEAKWAEKKARKQAKKQAKKHAAEPITEQKPGPEEDGTMIDELGEQGSDDLPPARTGSEHEMPRSMEYGSDYNKYAKLLKNNTEVMQATFEKHNLQLLQFSFRPYSEADADCTCIIEIKAIRGSRIDHDVAVKVNLYDKDGEICVAEEGYLYSEDFDEYDTVTVYLYDGEQALLNAKSARIFATKY